MTQKWFKIWTEESKKDTNSKQLYLRLIEDSDTKDILLAITKADGEIYDRNIVLQISEPMRAIMFHGIDDDLPLKTDIRGVALYTDYIEQQIMQNGFKGNSITLPAQAMKEMAEKIKEAAQRQMDLHEKETKH